MSRRSMSSLFADVDLESSDSNGSTGAAGHDSSSDRSASNKDKDRCSPTGLLATCAAILVAFLVIALVLVGATGGGSNGRAGAASMTGGRRLARVMNDIATTLDGDGHDALTKLLDERIEALATKACTRVPSPPKTHTIDWNPQPGVNPISLPALDVSVGDNILFTNTDQNSGQNPKNKKKWLSDVWQTNKADFDACRLDRSAGSQTKQIAWGAKVHDGSALFLIHDEHLLQEQQGASLYFIASNSWKNKKWSWCGKRGVKMEVRVHARGETTKCGGKVAALLLNDGKTDLPTAQEEAEKASAALVATLSDTVTALSKTVKRRTSTVQLLSQQLLLQAFQSQERVRSEGSSGIVSVRGFKGGLAAFADGSFFGRGLGAIHNHGNFMDTMGMGEVEVVLNGVLFKTRHNDYRLQQPSTTDGSYGAVQSVRYPDVPRAVEFDPQTPGVRRDVPAQVEEMQKWFKAFKAQDVLGGGDGVARDYTKHFRPILCYLEGAWITDDDSILNRDGDSDRHNIEASNTLDLHNKTMYMANSGRKNTRENLAVMPSAVRRMVVDAEGDVVPEVANFEYRIACQPLEGDVPTGRFRVAQDLQLQLNGRPETRSELGRTRRARFEVHPSLSGKNNKAPEWTAATAADRHEYEYLDTLMEQVWGKDNAVEGTELFDDLEGNRAMHHQTPGDELNVAKYSRFYQLRHKDAMGFQTRRRGFNDRFMWAARTTQENVSPVAARFGRKKHDDKVKVDSEQRWSYAIPLEIVYLTPLTKWNPYNITDHTAAGIAAGLTGGDLKAAERAVVEGAVDKDGNTADRWRNGRCDQGEGMALNGVRRSLYYRTPVEFYAGTRGERDEDPADTSGNVREGTCVLDNTGTVRRVVASGHNVFIPAVGSDVGTIRQRYPIMPLHFEGAAGWKETKALAALTLDGDDYEHHEHAFDEGPFGEARDEKYGFNLVLTGGGHEHTVYVSGARVKLLAKREKMAEGNPGKTAAIMLPTEDRNGHQHYISLSREHNTDDDGTPTGTTTYKLGFCEFRGNKSTRTNFKCLDGHDTLVRRAS